MPSTLNSQLLRCSRCLIPETHETIIFDAAGVCNVCRQHEIKQAIDWDKKKRDLDALIEQHRGKHAYDCIVPFSGGKDSAYTLWYLMHTYKIKPLVVSFDHGFLRPGVLANNERALQALGCDFPQVPSQLETGSARDAGKFSAQGRLLLALSFGHFRVSHADRGKDFRFHSSSGASRARNIPPISPTMK